MIWFWIFITYAIIAYVINCFFNFILLFGFDKMPVLDTVIYVGYILFWSLLWPFGFIYLYLCYRYNRSNVFLEFLTGKEPYNPESGKTLWQGRAPVNSYISGNISKKISTEIYTRLCTHLSLVSLRMDTQKVADKTLSELVFGSVAKQVVRIRLYN